MQQFYIPDEAGLTYNLDLQEGSKMAAPTPTLQARRLPVYPCSYGYFFAGNEHFTFRNQYRCLYQIFITYHGEGHFIVDDREFIARPDTVILLDLGMPHRYESLNGIWEHEWVNFSGAACQIYYDLINPNGVAVYSLGGDCEVRTILREIGNGIMNQDMMGFMRTGTNIIRLLNAMYDLVMHQQRLNILDQYGNILRSVDYINAHYMERLNLEKLAQAAYLSKYHYNRAFKKYLGMTPFEYLNSVRISHAKPLLLTTRMSVEEISWQVGCFGSKNLIRLFKKTTNMTPNEFRKYAGAEGVSSAI